MNHFVSETPETTVEILPISLKSRTVLKEFNDFISKSKVVYGAVAYWTINHNLLNENFVKSINEDGFVCVDIHYPTNLDTLLPIVEQGGNIFLHLYKANEKDLTEESRLPKHLMHSKIFLFKIGEKAVIWIGSHNATNRALQGMNIETAVIITTSFSSEFSRSVLDFLNGVKNRCDQFQVEQLKYYKWLQNRDNHGSEISLINLADPNDFIRQETNIRYLEILLLLCDQPKQKLQQVNSAVLISIQSESGTEYYDAKIDKCGNLDDNAKDKLELKWRFYAIEKDKKVPIIEEKNERHSILEESNKSTSTFFIVFKLEDRLPNDPDIYPCTEKKWEASKQDDDIPIIINNDECEKPDLIKILKAISFEKYNDRQSNIGSNFQTNIKLIRDPKRLYIILCKRQTKHTRQGDCLCLAAA